MLCGWGVKAGMVHPTCGQMCGWQVKMCDPSSTSEYCRDEFLMIKYHINLHLLYLLTQPKISKQ